MRISLGLLLPAALALAACGEERAVALGAALDPAGNPVAGATITLGERAARSGPDGRFALDLGKNGDVTLRVDGAATLGGPHGVGYLRLAGLPWRRSAGSATGDSRLDERVTDGERFRFGVIYLPRLAPDGVIGLTPRFGGEITASEDPRYKAAFPRVPGAAENPSLQVGLDPIPAFAAPRPGDGRVAAAAVWFHPAELELEPASSARLELPNERGVAPGTEVTLLRLDTTSEAGTLELQVRGAVSADGQTLSFDNVRRGGCLVAVVR